MLQRGSKAVYQLCAGARSLPDIGSMLGLRAAYDHAYTSASQLQCELADATCRGVLKKPQILSEGLAKLHRCAQTYLELTMLACSRSFRA